MALRWDTQPVIYFALGIDDLLRPIDTIAQRPKIRPSGSDILPFEVCTSAFGMSKIFFEAKHTSVSYIFASTILALEKQGAAAASETKFLNPG